MDTECCLEDKPIAMADSVIVSIFHSVITISITAASIISIVSFRAKDN